MTETEIKLGISKFRNIGGITCYMNSILVILQQCPLFADYIVIGLFCKNILEKYKNVESEDLQEIIYKKVSYQLYKLFDVSMKKDDFCITPTTLKTVIGLKDSMWKEYRHQDSDEFFAFLINTMAEELGKEVQLIPGRNFVSTFLYPEHYEEADSRKHLHFDDLKPHFVKNPETEFVLIHFSCRYKKEEIIVFSEENSFPNVIWWI